METFKSEDEIYMINPNKVNDFIKDLYDVLDNEVKKKDEQLLSGFLLFENSKIPRVNQHILETRYDEPKNFFGKTISILTDEVEENSLKPFTLGEIVMSEDGSQLTMKLNESDSLAINPKVIYDATEKYLA